MNRAEARTSEVFIVVLEPGEAPPLHKHDDPEQIFHILEGDGILRTGVERQELVVRPTDVGRIPPRVLYPSITIAPAAGRELKIVASMPFFISSLVVAIL